MKKFLITGAAMIVGLAAGAANAQSIKSDPTEQITVVPPMTTHQSATPLKGGMNSQVIALNRYVDYGDLDLSRQSDQRDLENRIHATARGACDALDAKFPQNVFVPVGNSQDCVGTASRGALAMADIPRNASDLTDE